MKEIKVWWHVLISNYPQSDKLKLFPKVTDKQQNYEEANNCPNTFMQIEIATNQQEQQ